MRNEWKLGIAQVITSADWGNLQLSQNEMCWVHRQQRLGMNEGRRHKMTFHESFVSYVYKVKADSFMLEHILHSFICYQTYAIEFLY